MTRTITMTGRQWREMIEGNKDDSDAATAIAEVTAALASYRESIAGQYLGDEALDNAVANKTHTITITIG